MRGHGGVAQRRTGDGDCARKAENAVLWVSLTPGEQHPQQEPRTWPGAGPSGSEPHWALKMGSPASLLADTFALSLSPGPPGTESQMFSVGSVRRWTSSSRCAFRIVPRPVLLHVVEGTCAEINFIVFWPPYHTLLSTHSHNLGPARLSQTPQTHTPCTHMSGL